ncbi:MAG: site-specific DNA-methyltransferase [Oscillospiraceae bacterium]|nr:site-specific DNA-methyltransferase [Oscillospiraceae bacterium]
MKSARNKTISLLKDEEQSYLTKCLPYCSNKNTSNTIIHGDAMGVLPTLPQKTVDLLIVDPPYNLDKKYGSTPFRQTSNEEYIKFTREWIEKAVPSLKPHASIYVCADWKTSLVIGAVLSDYFVIQNRITWQREKGRGALANWKNSMEDIWFATLSPKNYTFNVDDVKIRRKVIAPYKENGNPKDWYETKDGNFRDTFPSNFWDDITIPYWSMPENTTHPTQKPEKLMAKLILASSNVDDLVLDPFLGSGTTAVVAKKLGRNYIGIEKEAEYCAISQKRLETIEKRPAIQGYEQGVFWERNTLTIQKTKAKNEETNAAQVTF